MKPVADPELREALRSLEAAIDTVSDVGVNPYDHRDANTLIKRIEALGRKVDAVRVDLVEAIDREGLHQPDGFFSAKFMVRHHAKLSNAEAVGRSKSARALRELPALRTAWKRGEIGTCQVRRLSRVFANKRVRDALIVDEQRFVHLARRRSYKDFDAEVSNWERLVDEDGTADRSQATHDNRDVKLTQEFDLGWNLSARCGSLQGAQIRDILNKFIEAEFVADWEKAAALHGEGVTKDLLERTDSQRRFDALHEVFMRGATNPSAGARPRVITNIVIDQATFERELRRLAGENPGPSEPWDPNYRCHTLDRRPIEHSEAIAAALLGRVKRVVINAAGVTIDMSRDTRLFSGNARLAVQLGHHECFWPGCHVPVSDCQIDHMKPFAERDDGGGGCTNPENGAPACGRHNRLKERGFTAHRDPAGGWHILRPDGTELT